MDTGLQVKESTVKYRTDFWRRAARTSKLLKVRNEVIRERMRVRQKNFGRLDNITLKYYGQVVRMEDKR